jgi:hypothetical protein
MEESVSCMVCGMVTADFIRFGIDGPLVSTMPLLLILHVTGGRAYCRRI